MSDTAISIRGLKKSYGSTEAVRGIDLEVNRGEVFAFLGPNGAGKTTTVEILEGFRQRSAGEVSVLGVDPWRADRRWRARIGLVLQRSQLVPELTVRETLALYAGYYPAPRPIEETLKLVGLSEEASQRAGRLSGGQQRRLDVAIALVGDPELIFLDEPTTGFDPAARRQAWEVIQTLRGLGKTVFLTTHYMQEAEELANRVAVIADGKIRAFGTPETLAQRDGAPSEIGFALPSGVALGDLPPELGMGAELCDGNTARIRVSRPVGALHALTDWALHHGHELPDLRVTRPSLEEIYLQLTSES
jgi:ABC-2 type transport system ATP-binding protein